MKVKSPPAPSDLPGPTVLSRSEFYRTHREAVSEATGLPVTLHAPGEFHIDPSDGSIPEFCRTMARDHAVCGFCCEEHRRLQDPDGETARTMKCFSGMSSSAVPVTVGDRPAAYLHTGHVFLDEASDRQIRRMERILRRRSEGSSGPAEAEIRVVPGRQYRAGVKVLEMFARQLAEEARHLPPATAPAAVARAMVLLRSQYEHPWSLGELAETCHIHPTYLSETFHAATGRTFTEFLAGVRVENAARSLHDPNRRISDIALSVGFRSLSQFNRVFLKMTGLSPTAYRRALQEDVLGDGAALPAPGPRGMQLVNA